MSRVIHVFRTPDRFVAGTVGEPGDRTFYLQAVDESKVISVQLEKEQVAVLAERLSALLDEVVRRLGDAAASPGEPAVDTEPLSTPVEQEFRVGTMGLGWDIESRAIVVELLAVSEQEVDESMVLDDTEDGPDAVRVFLSLVQARAFTTRAERVISAGRRPCPLCKEPLGPKGHICPRQNGYRRQAEA
ncbi:MAG: DUF3090 domain-containing protein [Pseudonocardiaceae bacterium]|jgi:uncharacterized repeat protein (TIGR03847 family)|nr:DUF3090 domain-containing protein [Pseudonocardiaceae bacterium]